MGTIGNPEANATSRCAQKDMEAQEQRERAQCKTYHADKGRGACLLTGPTPYKSPAKGPFPKSMPNFLALFMPAVPQKQTSFQEGSPGLFKRPGHPH